MEKSEAVTFVMDAIVDSVAEGGEFGAPAGVLYASLMSVGVSLETFNGIMNLLVNQGRLKKEGHIYYVV